MIANCECQNHPILEKQTIEIFRLGVRFLFVSLKLMKRSEKYCLIPQIISKKQTNRIFHNLFKFPYMPITIRFEYLIERVCVYRWKTGGRLEWWRPDFSHSFSAFFFFLPSTYAYLQGAFKTCLGDYICFVDIIHFCSNLPLAILQGEEKP